MNEAIAIIALEEIRDAAELVEQKRLRSSTVNLDPEWVRKVAERALQREDAPQTEV